MLRIAGASPISSTHRNHGPALMLNAPGGGRTRTSIAGQGILSPLRLPVSPQGQGLKIRLDYVLLHGRNDKSFCGNTNAYYSFGANRFLRPRCRFIAKDRRRCPMFCHASASLKYQMMLRSTVAGQHQHRRHQCSVNERYTCPNCPNQQNGSSCQEKFFNKI